jgi:hypothetical protein
MMLVGMAVSIAVIFVIEAESAQVVEGDGAV